MLRLSSARRYTHLKFIWSFTEVMLKTSLSPITTTNRRSGISTYRRGGWSWCRNWSTKLAARELLNTRTNSLKSKLIRTLDKSVYSSKWTESRRRQPSMCGASRCDLKSSMLWGASQGIKSRLGMLITKYLWQIEREFKLNHSKPGPTSTLNSRKPLSSTR